MRRALILGILAALSAVSIAGASTSKPLVTDKFGPTYEIAEKDAIQTIYSKLEALKSSGKLKEIEQQAQARAEKYMLEPEPVKNITTVEKSNTRYFDPTWTLNTDIYDNLGNKIASKGTRVNPLEVKAVNKKLFFFDGRDLAQVEMAKKFAAQYGSEFTPVLTAGSWVDTSEKLQQAVYFDQMGKMTSRLTVTSVPTLVMQEGNRMRIEEIKP